jgi:LPXTG-site transpeptidase (sortase) family protein
VFTRSNGPSKRGDYRKVAAALGVAMIALGLGLPRVSPIAGLWAGDAQGPDQKVVSRTVPQAPYVVGPSVHLKEPRTAHRAAATGTPTRIVIPSLGVDNPVIGIDVSDGVLTPPNDPQVLGWWRDGAQPGAVTGSAVITGHTVHTGGGAFDNLDTLKPGNRVTIRTDKGRITYRVTRVIVYAKASLAQHAQEVFSQSGPGRLVLVTCDNWTGSEYLSNAVVYANRLPHR